ncbi:MAG: GNVR domain-containing protein [Desulfobacterales bacterium]|nr:GNVR domain-containing protein [Desulfobacterales bacterium]
MEQENIDLGELKNIIVRRRWSFIVPAGVVFFLALVLALALPPVYKSTSTILIEEQEIPADYVITTVTSYVEQRLQTINQRIMSTTRLLEIIDRFNLYANLREKRTTEEIVAEMREDVMLEPISTEVVDKRTGRDMTATIAFTLSYEAKEDPATVQRVATQLTSLFLEENLRVRERQTMETSQFLKDETERVKAQLEATEAEIAAFKKDHINKLPEMLQLNIQKLSDTERNIERLQENLRALKEKEGYLQSELATTPQEWYQNWIAQKDEDVKRLEYLEVELISLKTRYSDEYPDVIKTRQEINRIKERLDAAGVDYSRKKEEDKPENPAYINLSAQLSGARSEIDTVQRMIAINEGTAEKYRKRIAATPAVEEVYTELLSRQTNIRAKYNDLLQKTMEAEVAHGLEKGQKGERFTLIDPARLPEKPSKPNRLAIVLIGIVLGIGAGVGWAALREFTDDAVRNAEILTRQTGFPVLSGIPLIVTPAEAARRLMMRKVKIITAAAAIPVGIIIFHFLIMDLDIFWAKLIRRLAL